MKNFFLVLGLPRSGSTLLTNLLNSQDDGFCISEPIWEKFNFKTVKNYGKVSIDNYTPYNSITHTLKNYLENSEYSYGGLKETYRSWQKECVDIALKGDYDFIIKIYRDPIQNYSSWKKTNWGAEYRDINKFISSYNELKNLNHKKIYELNYEMIVKDGIDYINSILPFKLKRDEIIPAGFRYGDVKANSSKRIIKPTNYNSLTESEITEIKKNIDVEGIFV